jgi:hypothetical protein
MSADLMKTLIGTLITSFGAILPVAVSGYFLLRSHHTRVEAELKIRSGTEEFKRKQRAYDAIWSRIYEALDFSQHLLDETNWRLARATQAGHLLAGSEDVVRDYNTIMDLLGKEAKTQSEMNKTDAEITRFSKKLWNDMRWDLYKAKPLPDDAIKFVGPGERTKRALTSWMMNKDALERVGVFDLVGLSAMDTEQISRKTGGMLRVETLQELKSMANRELRYVRESQELNHRDVL